MKEEDARRLMRDNGLCGHVDGPANDHHVCILTKGHDGGKHDGPWSVETPPLKIEAIPVREVWRLRNNNMTHTALSMLFASSKEGAEQLCKWLNMLGEEIELVQGRPHPAQVAHRLTAALMATEKQIEIAEKRGDFAGAVAWRESQRAIQDAMDRHGEARSKQKW